MKTNLISAFKTAFLCLLLLFAIACSKKNEEPGPKPAEPTSSLSGTVDGNTITVNASNILTTYYATDGDAVKALSVNSTLSTNGKIAFFIADLKNGTITLSKKLGTSLNPGSPGIKVNATGATANTTQTYVSYAISGNTYYAYSGTIEVTINGSTATLKWNLSFKDANGRDFTSAGTTTIVNYNSLVQPKNTIIDPTPVSFTPIMESMSATEGFVGDTITVNGVNYSTVLTENVFKFNGTNAVILTATSTKLTVKVPENGSTGSVSLKVKNSAELTGPKYTYMLPAIITSFSPTTAKVGDTIIVKGTNFSENIADNAIKFFGRPAKIISASTTQLSVIVPARPSEVTMSGKLSLWVKNRGPVESVESFTVKPTLPGIALKWEDLNFTDALKNNNQFAALGNKILLTGAGSAGGYIYLSTNGTTFTNIINSVAAAMGSTIYSIPVIASSSTAFYVMSYKNGIVKSTDGINWKKLPLTNQNVNSMAVYGETIIVSDGTGLATSIDGGDHFYLNIINAPNRSEIDYIVSDSNGKNFYLTNSTGYLFKAIDQTYNWTKTAGKLGSHHYNSSGADFLKANSGGVFMLFGQTVSTQNLYRSTDQAESWVKVTDDQVNTIKSIGSSLMYGGLSFNISNDGGNTFTRYLAPEDWLISGIEKTGTHYYVSCYKAGTTQTKIFRTPVF